MAVTAGRRPVPRPPSPLRVAKARATTSWHSAWGARHSNTAPFDRSRSRPGSDYNLHHVDLEADGRAQDELAAGMGAIDAASTVAEVGRVLARLTG